MKSSVYDSLKTTEQRFIFDMLKQCYGNGIEIMDIVPVYYNLTLENSSYGPVGNVLTVNPGDDYPKFPKKLFYGKVSFQSANSTDGASMCLSSSLDAFQYNFKNAIVVLFVQNTVNSTYGSGGAGEFSIPMQSGTTDNILFDGIYFDDSNSEIVATFTGWEISISGGLIDIGADVVLPSAVPSFTTTVTNNSRYYNVNGFIVNDLNYYFLTPVRNGQVNSIDIPSGGGNQIYLLANQVGPGDEGYENTSGQMLEPSVGTSFYVVGGAVTVIDATDALQNVQITLTDNY